MKIEQAFWDTSAIVPLCCHQTHSFQARQFSRQGHESVIWWGTPVEAHSALVRLWRTGEISPKAKQAALKNLAALEPSWWIIEPELKLRQLAREVLDRYDLRAADALQLAAALFWCDEKPRRRTFICFDIKLAAAARTAGFTVLP